MMRLAAALAIALSAGCGPTALGGPTGAPCMQANDCASSFCLPAPFQDGYCSSDCSMASCAAGELCQVVDGFSVCLKPCAAAADCRMGYMCFQGACRPSCTADAECGKGYGCTGGQCAPLPGKKVGDACAMDAECSSRFCDPASQACQIQCLSDGECPTGQTCWANAWDSDGDGSTDAVDPICIPKRKGGAALGAACKADAGCAEGQCELGVCTTLCRATGNCGAGTACVGMIAQVDIGAPKIKACLMKTGTLTYDLGRNGSGPVGMPDNAVSFAIWVEAMGEPLNYYAGVTELTDPAGNALYTPPKTLAEYFALPVRYEPVPGVSTMLVPNAPSVPFPIVPGQYQFGTFAATQQGGQTALNARLRIKLDADGAPSTGAVPLHVFVTNLSGGCRSSFTAANASGALGQFEATVKKVYQQAGITIDPIQYFDSNAPNAISASTMGESPQLDALLKAATTGDTPDVLELTIIKSISATMMNGYVILGIAGGIPASPGIPGTVHSGATVSLASWCMNNDNGHTFGLTSAHELGHTLGLFHNTEQAGTDDALPDTAHNDNTNLMYWDEESGSVISPMQGAVMRANPTVGP